MRRLHLPIQDPCHEDWDAMSHAEGKRRFCESCAKHVHDVSAMTESEARMVLAEESSRGRVCVRYTVDGRTGGIKYKVESVTAPMLAAASMALALFGTGCTTSEPTRVDADGCSYEVGPWSFRAERGEGTCPDIEPEVISDVVDQGQVVDPVPDIAVAGGLGAEPIEPMVMGEAPAIVPPPQVEPTHAKMGKIAAPPTEHVKMGDVALIDEPCDPLGDPAGADTTPTTPPPADDRPRRL